MEEVAHSDNSNYGIQIGSTFGPQSQTNEPSNLKSNLKKALVKESQPPSTEKRKVTWPDAHGKDIAHIQEFEPR